MDDNINIILVGFMGTGKSAAAKLVAQRLRREFVDMDAVIEQRAGCTISTLFETKGEPAFREMERTLVRELAARSNLVIAAGGGVVVNPENVKDFSRTGRVICLHAEPDVILQRVLHDTHRPLLEHGDKARRITDLLESRRALYGAIPLQIDTTHETPESTAEHVIGLYNKTDGRKK